MPPQEGISGPLAVGWLLPVPLWQHIERLVILTITCPMLDLFIQTEVPGRAEDLASSSVGPGLGWGSFSTFSKWKECCSSHRPGAKEKRMNSSQGGQLGHQVEGDI